MNDSVRLFSTRTEAYAQFRPTYPAGLFAWLASQCVRRESALDLATGNGQAALPLCNHFDRVLACDASIAQLQASGDRQNLRRFACRAEQLPLRDGQLDLIVVAQALHWFATEQFFDQARRALRPDGLFCAWCYSLLSIEPSLDAVITHLHGEILADCWPMGRASVDAGYRDIEPPFPLIEVPTFQIETAWTLHQLLGYLRTWSAAKRWQQVHGADPIDIVQPELLRRWGDPELQRTIRWPLHFLAGYPRR